MQKVLASRRIPQSKRRGKSHHVAQRVRPSAASIAKYIRQSHHSSLGCVKLGCVKFRSSKWRSSLLAETVNKLQELQVSEK